MAAGSAVLSGGEVRDQEPDMTTSHPNKGGLFIFLDRGGAINVTRARHSILKSSMLITKPLPRFIRSTQHHASSE